MRPILEWYIHHNWFSTAIKLIQMLYQWYCMAMHAAWVFRQRVMFNWIACSSENSRVWFVQCKAPVCHNCKLLWSRCVMIITLLMLLHITRIMVMKCTTFSMKVKGNFIRPHYQNHVVPWIFSCMASVVDTFTH